MRLCTKCKTEKQEELFYKSSKYKNTGLCKICKRIGDKVYIAKNKEKISLYYKELWKSPKRKAETRIRVHKHRFGFDVDEMRKEGHCVECGIDNEECKKKYGKYLNVDHINNKGRSVNKPDNRRENLQLLCQSCHTVKSNTVDCRYKYENRKKHNRTRTKINS